MEGAFIGDIVGSIYEWQNHKSKEFPLFSKGCRATDDSVMTCAVAEAFQKAQQQNTMANKEIVMELLRQHMRKLGQKYPNGGYGGKFLYWLLHPEMGAYGSFGNGAAMRVSPAGWFGRTLQEARTLALWSCEVTHNHPDSYRAAQAVAGAIFLARQHKTKVELRNYLEQFYCLDFTVESIRDSYQGDATCNNSVPQALVCFLDAIDFEDAIRNAISLGGDSDTLGAIAGSIAEPYFGIPQTILTEARKFYLPEMELWEG